MTRVVNPRAWWDQSPSSLTEHETKNTYSHLDVSIYCCVGWSLFKQMTQTNIFAPIKNWIINTERCMLTFELVAMYKLGKGQDLDTLEDVAELAVKWHLFGGSTGYNILVLHVFFWVFFLLLCLFLFFFKYWLVWLLLFFFNALNSWARKSMLTYLVMVPEQQSRGAVWLWWCR